MYTGRFVYLYVLLAAVGAAFLIFGGYALVATLNDPVTVRQRVPAPLLVGSDSIADVKSRFGETPQTMTGAQAGPAVSANCPQVDIYQQVDGAVLVCRG